MPAVSAWAQSLLAGDKIPDLTWTISEETGEIVATVTQRDAIIHEAKMWYALPDTHCIALHCTRIIDPLSSQVRLLLRAEQLGRRQEEKRLPSGQPGLPMHMRYLRRRNMRQLEVCIETTG